MGCCEGGVVKSRVVSEVALYSALIIVTRLFKLHLHVPGSGSMVWIAIMLVARGLSRFPATSTLIGLVVGVVASVSGIDMPPGPHQLLKYLLAGASIDALGYLIMRRLPNQVTYALAGAAASLSKMFSVYMVALLLSIPVFVVKAVLAYVAALNTAFGCVAGVIAYYVVRAALKARCGGHGRG